MSIRKVEAVQGAVHVVDIHYDSDLKEYRVTYHGAPSDRREATAHYTNDLMDARGTADIMANRGVGWAKSG